MKPPPRTKSIGTKVSEAEFAVLEEQARASGLTLSEWVRGRLLAAPETDRPGSEPEPDSGAVVLAEVLALRTILMNLLFSISNGKAVTAEGMRELIEKADGDKSRRAGERLMEARAEIVPQIEPIFEIKTISQIKTISEAELKTEG